MTFEEYIKHLDNKLLLSLSLPKELLAPSKLLSDRGDTKREEKLFKERISNYKREIQL